MKTIMRKLDEITLYIKNNQPARATQTIYDFKQYIEKQSNNPTTKTTSQLRIIGSHIEQAFEYGKTSVSEKEFRKLKKKHLKEIRRIL